ncbi:hypothetical protein CU098_006957, partial [Rhizopus stolonifer]
RTRLAYEREENLFFFFYTIEMDPQKLSPSLQQDNTRSISHKRTASSSSHLIPPVTTHRKQSIDDDELNKNISLEYQDIQIRTLTKWINVQLNQVGDQIISIDKDLRDGKKLLKLLSVVANRPQLKPERGNMRIHALSNVSQALKFLQEQWGADSLPAIGSEAIVNGDVKSTLALAFFIMLKYQIHPILLNDHTLLSDQQMPPPSPLPTLSASRLSGAKPLAEAKSALLYWVRSQLEDYVANHVISTVQDFSRSWRSGLAFCLLIHRHDPDLLPTLFTEHIQHVANKDTWHTLLNLAFDVAEQRLNVPKYLESADLLIEFPHEPSVMMYVSEMYKVMSRIQETFENRQKRLHDISLVITTIEDEQDTKSPATPQPEPFLDEQGINQQLDGLASFINSDPVIKQVEDMKPFMNQLDNMMHHCDPEQQKQLISRYNQLRADWERLSQQIETPEHVSTYINESNPSLLHLREMIPKNEQQEPLHPLDGTIAMADEFERSLSHITTLINLEKEQDPYVLTIFQATTQACQLFRRGVTFAQITLAIDDELDVIQKLMADRESSTVTDELIQSLEQRIHLVNATIQGVRDEYGHDLLVESTQEFYTRFTDCIDHLEDRYETVRDWVDQVRVWFVEAERIRAWIDRHIQIIEERNAASEEINPVSPEVSVLDKTVFQLHDEHERLKQEIEHFDSDDMDRLRAHVKMLTHSSELEKELTPADTSTIEITLTTLNRLSHLTKLLDNRSHWIQMLLLRVKWENAFSNAVQWIAQTDSELDVFIQTKARWSEKEEANYVQHSNDEEDHVNNHGIEDIIKALVGLERKIADFDHGLYAQVLDAYQEIEALKNEPLPDYLEARQLGFERAFEDLMKRSGFGRKLVEQLLSMVSTVDRFKVLRDIGEQLRQQLLQEASSSHQALEEEDMYAEKVQEFKEDSARLITNASTCIPYPVAPEMSTAIGAHDAHDSDVTNESIRSTISGYSMSLALIADGLDQLLMSRYQVMSLQQRASEAFESMARFKLWMDERIKLLKKSRFDMLLYNASMSSSSSQTSTSSFSDNSESHLNQRQGAASPHTSSSGNTSVPVDDEDFLRFEKERDSIASRLHQLEHDDLTRLFDSVRALEYDIDASNAVSIDRSALINGVESLQESYQRLSDLVNLRGVQLDALKRRMDWENQWSKSNSHLQTIARKLCDFNVKKARYDPSKENVDKPSYSGDHETMQSLQFLQERVAELGERHLSSLDECFQELVTSYGKLPTESMNGNLTVIVGVPDFISSKQSDLKIKYDDLRLLASYTSDLVAQRSTITEFLMRAQDAHHEGEKIKDAVSKKTRRIMVKEEEDTSLDNRFIQFKEDIRRIWEECGKDMPYPVYNGNWLKSSPTQHHSHHAQLNTDLGNNSAYRSQVRAQVKELLDKKMDDLYALEKTIDQSLTSYHDADRMKALVNQYEQEACELGQWIHQQIELLKRQHIDVSAESFLARGMNISDLKKSRLDMIMQADTFENDKVKSLHARIAQLVQDSMEKKKHQSVDVSAAARQLGEVMDHLSQLKRGLSDQAVTLEAASMRAEWEKNLQMGIAKLEKMNEQLRKFNAKKNEWVLEDELYEERVMILQQDLAKLVAQKNKFQKTIMPSIQLSYDTFVEYFPQLSRPIATPDHLEARMESLGRTAARFQESVEARSKELDLIKQRMHWEDIVRQALNFLANKESAIEAFEHEKDVIVSVEKRFENLVADTTDYYNDTSVTLLPNAAMKKMQDLKLAQERADYFLTFSNEVVAQRCLVSAFILRTAQLEQSAELIREEFIATKVGGANAQIVTLFESHAERLEKFKAGIDDVRLHLATSIPFPVRSLDNISTQAKIKDETTNAVIHEAIDIRNARLYELWSSLQQILESKERVSRRRLSLHAYKKQVIVVEEWIRSHLEVLQSSHVSQDSVDMEKLKEAVSQADSVEKAMKSNETVMSSLISAFEKCISAFEDKSLDAEELQEGEDYSDLSEEITAFVKPNQDRLVQDWASLLTHATDANRNRATLLMKLKIEAWLNALDDLTTRIHAETIANDDQLTLWSDEINQLENKEYQNLTLDMANNTFEEQDELLNTGKAKIELIRTKLYELQNELHLSQLIHKYMTDISRLQDMIQAQIESLERVHEEHLIVADEATPEHRETQHQTLVSKYKHAADAITDLKDTLNEVSGQHEAIISKSENYQDEKHMQITDAWNQLVSKESAISALIARSSKWAENYNTLAFVQKRLESVQSELAHNSPQVHDKISQELASIESLFSAELDTLSDDLLDDFINLGRFNARKSICINFLKQLGDLLKHQMTEEEKTQLVTAIKHVVDRLLEECQRQLDIANKHIEGCNLVDENEAHLQAIVNACSQLVDTNESVYSASQNKLDSVRAEKGEKLKAELGCAKDEVNQLFVPIISVLDKLHHTTQSEKEYLSIIRLVSQYVHNKNSLLNSIDSNIDKLNAARDTEEVVLELEHQSTLLDENAQDIYKLSDLTRHHKLDHLIQSEVRMKHVPIVIDQGDKMIEERLCNLKQLLQAARENIDNTNKRQQVITKLHDAIQFVADMTDRIQSFQLTGKGVISEERELEELCKDYHEIIEKKKKPIDSLAGTYVEDKEIEQLRNSLSTVMHELDNLIDAKQKEASDEGDLSDFLEMMAQVSQHITSLQTAIENASPHHSGIVNNKFVKADLQALLKTLVTEFKQHQQTVGKIFEKARAESKKQYSDNERVSSKLQKSIKRWNQVQAAAAARERELQTCISQLDHEFFTKLAIAKTAPRTVRKALQPTLPPTPPKKQVSPSATNSRNHSYTINGYKKTSKTPVSASSSASRVRAAYIPDPENELDMKLSHIVNAAPYRITIKSVPDQVGKYWFGDINPRLVYCRILPSQLVMVRVGGGWVELSKFLRDHGLTEGTYSRQGSPNDISTTSSQESTPFQEAFLNTFRSSSPSGRVTIRGGGGIDRNSSSLASTRSSSKSSGGSRSRSPLPGYVDGNNYISVDELGNHIVVKMKKADDDAKTPVINKKKALNA